MGQQLPAELGEIIGGYRLVSVVSQGGMGCVYRGEHARLGRVAAVKVLARHLMMDDEYVSRFFREARVVNEVRHPNIVDIFDFVEINEPRRIACVMEYIEGPTLKAVVSARRLSVIQSVNAASQLVGALQAVHGLNVVHRDLKPTNIIVTGDLNGDLSEVPSVKVLDFGIAKVEDAPGEHRTASGTMLGTPAYMAPEQVAADLVSPATDVYALGELFYEMVSGKRAYPGSRVEILKSKVVGDLPPLPLPPGISAENQIRDLVRRCLSQRPEYRPTLEELRAVLEDIRLHHPEDAGLELVDVETFPVGMRREDLYASTVDEKSREGEDAAGIFGLASPSSPVSPDAKTKSDFPLPRAPSIPADTVTIPAPDHLGSATETGSASAFSIPVDRLGGGKKLFLAFLGIGVLAVGAAIMVSVSGEPEVEVVPVVAAPAAVEPTKEQPPTEGGSSDTQPDSDETAATDLDPAAAVETPPVRTPPKQPPAAPKDAKVRVESTPSGAVIWSVATGQTMGKTPMELTIPPGGGPVQVRLKLPGYYSKVMKLDPGEPVARITLKRKALRSKVAPGAATKEKEPSDSSAYKKRDLPTW